MPSAPDTRPMAQYEIVASKAGTGTTRYAESFGFAQDKPGSLPVRPRFRRLGCPQGRQTRCPRQKSVHGASVRMGFGAG